MKFSESTRQIQNDGKFFEVKVFEAEQPKSIVAFAAGRGGSPDRHLALLRTIASCGCTVVAPYFDMLNALTPAKVELEARIERLEISLKMYSHFDQPMAGIGHSIGATLLLTLAGGKAITFSGDHLGAKSIQKFERLALLAPPVDFFLHPGALQLVDTQIYMRNGGKDNITPAAKALLFKETFDKQGQIKLMLDEEAGHFSYMDELPPQIEDCQPSRNAFLSDLAKDVARFLAF